MTFVRRFAGAVFLAVATALPVAADGLSEIETQIAAGVDANVDAELAFLERVVNVGSGTMSHDGVRETGAIFAAAFEEMGFETHWEELPPELERAGHLSATRAGAQGNRLLLIGHLDTVFEADAAGQKFRREGDTVWGPGISDMKGGDVVALFALKALYDAGALDNTQIEVHFTGDEEFPGRPVEISRKSLVEAAKRADVALNFEGGERGVGVNVRRGISGWRLTTTGLRRHSSGIFRDEVGAGAIFEAARILNEFYDELSREEYLTFNPGVILGGTDVTYDPERNEGSVFGKTNVVAQKVVVDGGLRFISEEQKEKAREKMRKIVAKHLPHTGATIEFTDSYPAMEPTDGNNALVAVFSEVSEDLGYGPVAGNDPAQRGAADISFAAPYVAAAMDGLGVRGAGEHTLDESMEVVSLSEATRQAAILIYRLTREDAPTF